MAGKIFVNYRRDDSPAHALSIAQYMERTFGARNVFIDVDRIRSGEQFPVVLEERLTSSKVMLAIIGPSWLDVRDDTGKRRLEDPQDWVRMEIARALKRGIKVIPVLVGGSRLPPPSDLPDELKPLVERQAAVITTSGFRTEMAGLAGDVEQIVGRDRRGLMVAALVVVAAIGLGAATYTLGSRAPWTLGLATVDTRPGADPRLGLEARLTDGCRNNLQAWRKAPATGAFAIAGNGSCGFSSGMPKLNAARTAALEACSKQGSDCRIFEVAEGDWTLHANCQPLLATWQKSAPARAFAVARSGHCFSVFDRIRLEDARSDAMVACERAAGECRFHELEPGNWVPRDTCRQNLTEWRTKPVVRVITVARNGKCAASWGYKDIIEARKRALSECEGAGSECRVLEETAGNWEPTEDCRKQLIDWRKKPAARAFVVGRDGKCGFNWNHKNLADAQKAAMTECASVSYECRVLEVFEGNWEPDESCKAGFEKWTRMRARGSFAVSQSGGCGWSFNYSTRAEADSKAMQECNTNGGSGCKLTHQR